MNNFCMTERKYLFVGEQRSPTAVHKDWKWEDGRLAAKQLFEALIACGIDPFNQRFVNVFSDDGSLNIFEIQEDVIVVGMGKTAQRELLKRNIPHREIIHPAARGKIRNKDEYAKHIRSILLGD